MLDNSDVDVILGLLSDRHHRRILYAIIKKPKSAFEISSECGIIMSTVYRKLKILKDHRLVNIKCLISSDGKKRFLYQSKIGTISAILNKDLLDVKVLPNSEILN